MKKRLFILALLVIFLFVAYLFINKDKEPKNKKGTAFVKNEIIF